MTWIYILGARNGEDIKIGRTNQLVVGKRLDQVDGEQMSNLTYVLLAAVLGQPTHETNVKRYFDPAVRTDKGTHREYFWPEPDLVEYAAWLRSQYFACPDRHGMASEWLEVDPEAWLPTPTRRWERPEPESGRLISSFQTLSGPLMNTPWDWFPDPKATIQDYFTPLEIVDAAREGMGGIDLDPASHWLANRTLKIPDYFTVSRSAFDNDWYGRVWLNPPYGDNERWWPLVVKHLDGGKVTQMAIISPVHAFTTKVAKMLMDRADAMVLLTPTPSFWGNADGKKGTNLPHAIVYFGPRRREMLQAFEPFGIPMKLDREDVA